MTEHDDIIDARTREFLGQMFGPVKPEPASSNPGSKLEQVGAAGGGLSEEELALLLCRCHYEICPLHNEHADDSVEFQVSDLIAAVERILAARAGLSPEAVTFTVGDDWPTPNACVRAATALDAITTARFGAILRAYAHAEERRFDEHGPIRQVRANHKADR